MMLKKKAEMACEESLRAEAVDKAIAEEEEKAIEEKDVELTQVIVEEEATSVKERLRRKTATAKKKKTVAPSAEPAVDPCEDIYLVVFHVRASFDMLGDPA